MVLLSPQGKVQAHQHVYPELGRGSVPSSLSSFPSNFRHSGSRKAKVVFRDSPHSLLYQDHTSGSLHISHLLFLETLTLLHQPTSTHSAKPSSEALSSWKPRLEKMPVFYISTAFRNVFQCLSILLVLLVSPSPFIWETMVPQDIDNAWTKTVLNNVLLNEHKGNSKDRNLFILPALKPLAKCSQLGPPSRVSGAQKEGMCL